MKCESCGFEMDKKYLKENFMGVGVPKLCMDCADIKEDCKQMEYEKSLDYFEKTRGG